MNNMLKIATPEFTKNVYVTFFSSVDGSSEYETGMVHEHESLHIGQVLGGTRFGGMFEVVNSPLTSAETRVLALRTLGVTTHALSKVLSVSEHTLHTQDKHVIHKLEVSSIGQAVASAFAGEAPFFVPYLQAQTTKRTTPFQKPVIQGLAEGLTTEELASSLSLSVSTIRHHIKKIYKLFDIPGDNRSSLVALAYMTDVVFEPSRPEIENQEVL